MPDNIVARLLAQSRKRLSAPDSVVMLAKGLVAIGEKSNKNGPEQTDLITICRKLELAVQYQPLSVDGLLQETEVGYLAIINSASKESRQRLSLAHEIGHVTLFQATGLRQAFGHLSPSERHSSESHEVEELCDRFALELIMPSDTWRNLVFKDGLSLFTLKKLKSVYGVSLATAARRFVEVASVECAVIIWMPVYEEGVLIRLDPVRCWETITLGREGRPQSIEPKQEFLVPGSPFDALKSQATSAGKISLPLSGAKGAYFAHSDVIDATHIITLMIPERLGREIMFCKPISDSK